MRPRSGREVHPQQQTLQNFANPASKICRYETPIPIPILTTRSHLITADNNDTPDSNDTSQPLSP